MGKNSSGRRRTQDIPPGEARQARITARRQARRKRAQKTTKKHRPWLLPLLVFVGLALAGVLALLASRAGG